MRFLPPYAFLLKSLKNYSQDFKLDAKKEKIETHTIRRIEIKLLPFRRKTKRTCRQLQYLHGRIEIYPRTLKSCQKLMQEFGKVSFTTRQTSKSRADPRAASPKYEKNLKKSARANLKYFFTFSANRSIKLSPGPSIYKSCSNRCEPESAPANKMSIYLG
jgi:hypothetical protein